MKQSVSMELLDHDTKIGLDQLESRVHARLNGRVRNLRILLRGRGIVLRGSAPSYHTKQLAQHTVMREAGLPILANEIKVT